MDMWWEIRTHRHLVQLHHYVAILCVYRDRRHIKRAVYDGSIDVGPTARCDSGLFANVGEPVEKVLPRSGRQHAYSPTNAA